MSDAQTELVNEVDRVHKILRTVWQEHNGAVSDVEWAIKYLPAFYDMAHAMIADRYSTPTLAFTERFPQLFTPGQAKEFNEA